MKKVLVTGGAGFIGSNLVKRLLKEYPKIEITVLDEPPKINKDYIYKR